MHSDLPSALPLPLGAFVPLLPPATHPPRPHHSPPPGPWLPCVSSAPGGSGARFASWVCPTANAPAQGQVAPARSSRHAKNRCCRGLEHPQGAPKRGSADTLGVSPESRCEAHRVPLLQDALHPQPLVLRTRAHALRLALDETAKLAGSPCSGSYRNVCRDRIQLSGGIRSRESERIS
jgi:hypothetical protein